MDAEKQRKFEKWKKEYPPLFSRRIHNTDENLFIQWLREKGFTTEQIADIIDVMDMVCTSCFDATHECQCYNDE